jgi:hypothetical protein
MALELKNMEKLGITLPKFEDLLHPMSASLMVS